MATNLELQPRVGSLVSIQANGDHGLGVVRFMGTTAFMPGLWFGLELDHPRGKNNGSINGEAYFECKSLHGLFVRRSGIKRVYGLEEGCGLEA